MFIEAVDRADTSLIVAYLVFVGALFVTVNTVVDLVYNPARGGVFLRALNQMGFETQETGGNMTDQFSNSSVDNSLVILKLDQIRTDGGTQLRVGTHRKIVTVYAEKMNEG